MGDQCICYCAFGMVVRYDDNVRCVELSAETVHLLFVCLFVCCSFLLFAGIILSVHNA